MCVGDRCVNKGQAIFNIEIYYYTCNIWIVDLNVQLDFFNMDFFVPQWKHYSIWGAAATVEGEFKVLSIARFDN